MGLSTPTEGGSAANGLWQWNQWAVAAIDTIPPRANGVGFRHRGVDVRRCRQKL